MRLEGLQDAKQGLGTGQEPVLHMGCKKPTEGPNLSSQITMNSTPLIGL